MQFSGLSALLAGDCSGSLRIQSIILPALFLGAAVVRDFDQDGYLEYFASGVVDLDRVAPELILLSAFQSNGIPENASSIMPYSRWVSKTAFSVRARRAGVTSTTFM
jgi:hypothetical protein